MSGFFQKKGFALVWPARARCRSLAGHAKAKCCPVPHKIGIRKKKCFPNKVFCQSCSETMLIFSVLKIVDKWGCPRLVVGESNPEEAGSTSTPPPCRQARPRSRFVFPSSFVGLFRRKVVNYWWGRTRNRPTLSAWMSATSASVSRAGLSARIQKHCSASTPALLAGIWP